MAVRFVVYLFLVVALTVLTQVGGVVLLLSIPLFIWIRKYTNSSIRLVVYSLLSFVAVYIMVSVLIIPPLAKSYGRVPLPVFNEKVKPLTVLTCLLNRHYVILELREVLLEVADSMNDEYPKTVVSYLDANFPFVDKFPLLPHLSHNDGKKLDIALYYLDTAGIYAYHRAPSFIGYGVFVDPLPGESDMPEKCKKEGYWQYGFLKYLVPQWNKHKFQFDLVRTKMLIEKFISNSRIQKVFIEPHLKNRMRLNYTKVRFHGCHAVRHDDHIHVQIN